MDTETRHRFMTYAVDRLTRLDDAQAVAAAEFTPEAAEAFLAACAGTTTADAAAIDRWLATIDAGTLAEGDMDFGAKQALCAISARQHFLRGGEAEPVAFVAIELLVTIDYEIAADIDDFLADPRMSAQYDAIRSLLG